jgi:hypothetical protein
MSVRNFMARDDISLEAEDITISDRNRRRTAMDLIFISASVSFALSSVNKAKYAKESWRASQTGALNVCFVKEKPSLISMVRDDGPSPERAT